MKSTSKEVRRVALFVSRATQMTREFFAGVMDFAATRPEWFVRVFEAGSDASEPVFDFGDLHYPDAGIVCDVPARFVRRVLSRRNLGGIPLVAFPQSGGADCCCCNSGGTCDCQTVAREAIKLFRRCGCGHVAYFGAHAPRELRLSRKCWRDFSMVAAEEGITATTIKRDVYDGLFVRSSEAHRIMEWIRSMPKPCGILAYDDILASSILNVCRMAEFDVPRDVNVLGIGNDRIVCEAHRPSVSSVELDYRRSGYLAARQIDQMLSGKLKDPEPISCNVKTLVERGSTRSRPAVNEVVDKALAFIRKNACRRGGLDQTDVAGALGISVRTLQLRFKNDNPERTILHEIQRVQLAAVCKALETTNAPIEDITFSCGFGSLSRLKVLFQKTFGMSMREWRRTHR